MCRAVIILSLFLADVVTVLQGYAYTCSTPRPTTRLSQTQFLESSLAPSPEFMSHVLEASGYYVRRLIAPWMPAFAGDTGARKNVWDFESAIHNPQRPHQLLSDKVPRSGSLTSDPYFVGRAKLLLERLRKDPISPKGMRRNQLTLQGKIFGVLVGESVPTELARRIAHQVALREYFNDPLTWKALGELLLQEVHQLRVDPGLPDHHIATVLTRLSADEARKLWEWLIKTDREIALAIFTRAVRAADPAAAARLYVDNYRLAFRAALKLDPAHAATLAGQVFAMRDALKKIKAKIKKKIKAQIQRDRAKWTLLLISAIASTAWLGSGDAFMAHKDGWLRALIFFGPLWPPLSFTKMPRDSLAIGHAGALAAAG